MHHDKRRKWKQISGICAVCTEYQCADDRSITLQRLSWQWMAWRIGMVSTLSSSFNRIFCWTVNFQLLVIHHDTRQPNVIAWLLHFFPLNRFSLSFSLLFSEYNTQTYTNAATVSKKYCFLGSFVQITSNIFVTRQDSASELTFKLFRAKSWPFSRLCLKLLQSILQ